MNRNPFIGAYHWMQRGPFQAAMWSTKVLAESNDGVLGAAEAPTNFLLPKCPWESGGAEFAEGDSATTCKKGCDMRMLSVANGLRAVGKVRTSLTYSFLSLPQGQRPG